MKTLSTSRLVLAAIAMAIAAIYSVRDGGDENAAPPANEEPSSGKVVRAKTVQARTCFFSDFRNKSWVEGSGVVKKVLPDDTTPPCHQRFILADPTGRTILIAHNIESWSRLADVRPGDTVEFRGEYVDNDRGGVVHWTHPDPAGRKPLGGGWLRKAGRSD